MDVYTLYCSYSSFITNIPYAKLFTNRNRKKKVFVLKYHLVILYQYAITTINRIQKVLVELSLCGDNIYW